MKRIIVITGIVLVGIIVCISCKPRQKCPAYGNHTYYENVDSAAEQKS